MNCLIKHEKQKVETSKLVISFRGHHCDGFIQNRKPRDDKEILSSPQHRVGNNPRSLKLGNFFADEEESFLEAH